MKPPSKGASRQWRKVRIEEIFAPLEDGRTMHQGWSPQCEKQPSPSEKVWGVLRTTSIQPGEFQPEHNKLLPSKLEPRPLLEVKPGDILITCAGPRIRCGISCLVENTRRRLMISGKMYRFRTRPDEVLPKYLVAFLQSEGAATAIDGMKTGGSESGLNLTHERFRQLLVPIGPLAEQQRIVGLLDEAFEGLATAKANADKNLHNARALFESHLQSVFTQRGPGWVEKRFDDVCAITSTLVDPRKKEFLDLTHVGAGNIESKTGVFVDLKTAREEGLISGKFLFDESMVLYSKIRPYLMKVARPDFEGLCSADMYPLSPIRNVVTRDYLFYLLLSKHFTDYAIQGSARAGMPKVNREHLFEFRVWLPDVKKQEELSASLDDLHEETQRLADLYERKLAALEALKKSLLHEAFTGEL
jgi:type I restriction enzyme, S subunit